MNEDDQETADHRPENKCSHAALLLRLRVSGSIDQVNAIGTTKPEPSSMLPERADAGKTFSKFG